MLNEYYNNLKFISFYEKRKYTILFLLQVYIFFLYFQDETEPNAKAIMTKKGLVVDGTEGFIFLEFCRKLNCSLMISLGNLFYYVSYKVENYSRKMTLEIIILLRKKKRKFHLNFAGRNLINLTQSSYITFIKKKL